MAAAAAGSPGPAAPVLVVDDEPHIRELVRLYLEKEGFAVIEAEDGGAALEAVAAQQPGLIVLDLMLPLRDGWEVCREVRRSSSVPIIMLTAKDDPVDRILGLEMGADDYLTKPFHPRELVARVRAVLRRAKPDAGAGAAVEPGAAEEHQRLEFADFSLDYTSRTLLVRGQETLCPPKEFELLWTLASHPDRVFSRETLLQQVWEYDFLGDLRTVDVHVQRLRKKIEPDANEPRYIKTVWGIGYKFEAPAGQAGAAANGQTESAPEGGGAHA
ncbi:MAG: response regulator [Symbiobacteriia bacterium]